MLRTVQQPCGVHGLCASGRRLQWDVLPQGRLPAAVGWGLEGVRALRLGLVFTAACERSSLAVATAIVLPCAAAILAAALRSYAASFAVVATACRAAIPSRAAARVQRVHGDGAERS